jgi:signal transduction histidine kinase
VRAVNADGTTSAAPAIISFTILRPFWQRWWFVSLVALALLALAYAVYRYRKLRQVELERVRKRIATDLHDDIGAGLSRIAVLSEVARHEADGSPVKERLSTIAGASRELVDSMSDIVWVINPERDQLRDLTQRMRRFASDVFAARETGLIFRVPGPEQQLKVGADVRRQVFLIFKEAINNVVRHAECATVEVELSVEAQNFALTVRDDGCGFDVNAAGEGNGLASMRMRAQLLGGELHLDSNAGQGTTLILRAPLKATVKDHNTRLHGIHR